MPRSGIADHNLEFFVDAFIIKWGVDDDVAIHLKRCSPEDPVASHNAQTSTVPSQP